MIAEEVLIACDEAAAEAGALAGGGDGQGLANPAVHFFRLTKKSILIETYLFFNFFTKYTDIFRGLRHRNLSAIRHATQRGLHQLQQLQQGGRGLSGAGFALRNRRAPLAIQPHRANPKGMIYIVNIIKPT